MMSYLWAAQWRSKNNLDGDTTHIIRVNLIPALFKTKRECLAFIKDEYGYIVKRKDLRAEPHCWAIPIPIKVKIEAI